MPYYNDEWLSELHSKINIEQVVSQYVELKSKGGRLWGCCPFHTEKTPSFTVDVTKGFFHCFGCGKGGNALHFVMEMEHLTFPEACAYLGERVGMEPPKNNFGMRNEHKSQEKKRAFEINRAAAHFFHNILRSKCGYSAKEYLLNRGIDERLQRVYGIGYAPDSWQELLDHLKSNGYSESEILNAGLAKNKENRYYDIFRNRIIFPIINQYSQVIGFGGRVMDGSEPKYLNTPDTPVFNKRQNLYNINVLRSQRDLKYVILVEGYMDAIALGKHGINNCVATLGTALTTEQARLIKRFSQDVFISYDGDSAGLKAALRAISITEAAEINCRVVVLPDKKDPDEYLKEFGADSYSRLVKNAKPAIEFQTDMLEYEFDISDDLQKEKYVKACIELLKKEKSSVLREKYAEYIAEKTGFSMSSILRDADDNAIILKQPTDYNYSAKVYNNQSSEASRGAEDYIISLLCNNSFKIKDLNPELESDAFIFETNKNIFEYLSECANNNYYPRCDEMLSDIDDEAARAHIAKLLTLENNFLSGVKNADSTLFECSLKLLIRKKQSDIINYINRAKEDMPPDERKDIALKISVLNKELYKLKSKLTQANV